MKVNPFFLMESQEHDLFLNVPKAIECKITIDTVNTDIYDFHELECNSYRSRYHFSDFDLPSMKGQAISVFEEVVFWFSGMDLNSPSSIDYQ